jgi:hypothetical protein
VSEVGSPSEPPEVLAVRASLRAAQERVDKATRQLGLAAELEQRLEALVESPSLPEALVLPSPEREAAELEATGILLEAELRAAKILNGPGPAALGPDAAHALAQLLSELAGTEQRLVELGRQALGIDGAPRPDNEPG